MFALRIFYIGSTINYNNMNITLYFINKTMLFLSVPEIFLILLSGIDSSVIFNIILYFNAKKEKVNHQLISYKSIIARNN